MGVEYIIKNSLLRRSLDNVTVVLIAFSNFKHAIFGSSHTHDSVEREEQQAPERQIIASISTAASAIRDSKASSMSSGNNKSNNNENNDPNLYLSKK